ncbi:MAG: cyclic nucleotide-binding domain-containing protein [Pseudomonadota bacterium]
MATTVATSTDAALQHLPRGAVVFEAGDRGGCWRVQRGILRLDRPSADGPVLVMLALPGDWLGSDTLCDHPHQWRATAVTPVVLAPRVPVEAAERHRWLVEALLQQPERCHDMARLRTGSVASRLAALLRLLGGPAGATPWHAAEEGALTRLREALPPLRVLAELVDAKHETVCRVLGQLLPRPREAAALVAA